jgi:hypothetical protein
MEYRLSDVLELLQDDNHESATANGMFTKLEKL